MPRLDETSAETTNTLEDMGVDWEKFVEDGNPIDVCQACYRRYGFTDDAEHPPYDDTSCGVNECAICGDELTPEDE